MIENRIDVIRMSASRPDLLVISTESLQRHLKFDGQLRFLLHEDYLNNDLSDKCVSYAESTGLFDVIVKDNPKIGQGRSLTKMLKMVNTKYIIHWEDDYELLCDLDLNTVVRLLDNNEDINQISFQKRQIMSEKPGFKKIEITRDYLKLTTNPHWAFIPAIWRVSFIQPKWVEFENDIHWRINDILKGKRSVVEADANWVIKNTGTYYFGGIDEGHYTNHIGSSRSLREGAEQKRWAKS